MQLEKRRAQRKKKLLQRWGIAEDSDYAEVMHRQSVKRSVSSEFEREGMHRQSVAPKRSASSESESLLQQYDQVTREPSSDFGRVMMAVAAPREDMSPSPDKSQWGPSREGRTPSPLGKREGSPKKDPRTQTSTAQRGSISKRSLAIPEKRGGRA